MRRRTVGRFKSALGFITRLLVTWKFYVRPTGSRRSRAVGERQGLSRCALGMALGEAEGGVAAGTEAEDITEVLKSERAGRHLPLSEDEIIASAELVAEQGITEDCVRADLASANRTSSRHTRPHFRRGHRQGAAAARPEGCSQGVVEERSPSASGGEG